LIELNDSVTRTSYPFPVVDRNDKHIHKSKHQRPQVPINNNFINKQSTSSINNSSSNNNNNNNNSESKPKEMKDVE